MTIAVLRGNGDLIWFDAIETFSERYTGALSTHPLESGGVITDHTTTNNLQISLAGIISDADFNISRPIITEDDSRDWGVNNKQFVNNSPVESQVSIKLVPSAARFLPESVSQFLTPNAPEVDVPGSDRPKFAAKIKDELTQMAGGVLGLVDAKGRPLAQEVFSLVDFQDGKIWRVISNLIITSLEFAENPDSGDAIYPVMQIERAKFATTKTTKVPKVSKKGRKTGDTTKRGSVAGDSKASPTNHSHPQDQRAGLKSRAANAQDFLNGVNQ